MSSFTKAATVVTKPARSNCAIGMFGKVCLALRGESAGKESDGRHTAEAQEEAEEAEEGEEAGEGGRRRGGGGGNGGNGSCPPSLRDPSSAPHMKQSSRKIYGRLRPGEGG